MMISIGPWEQRDLVSHDNEEDDQVVYLSAWPALFHWGDRVWSSPTGLPVLLSQQNSMHNVVLTIGARTGSLTHL